MEINTKAMKETPMVKLIISIDYLIGYLKDIREALEEMEEEKENESEIDPAR